MPINATGGTGELVTGVPLNLSAMELITKN